MTRLTDCKALCLNLKRTWTFHPNHHHHNNSQPLKSLQTPPAKSSERTFSKMSNDFYSTFWILCYYYPSLGLLLKLTRSIIVTFRTTKLVISIAFITLLNLFHSHLFTLFATQMYAFLFSRTFITR